MKDKLILTVITFFTIGSLMSCGGGSAAEGEAQQDSTAEQPAAAAPTYPSIPADTLRMLFTECDYIDYVFYYTNFSVSQKEKGDIQTALTYIASETPEINPNCKPVGRIFYQVEGENRAEADLYYTEQCIYYVFLEDGQPAYANRIMPAGINFYNKIFSSAQGH